MVDIWPALVLTKAIINVKVLCRISGMRIEHAMTQGTWLGPGCLRAVICMRRRIHESREPSDRQTNNAKEGHSN